MDYTGNTTHAALYIESYRDGKRLGSGTGFEISYSSPPAHSGEYHFVATAKHVINGADQIRVYLNRNLNQPDERAGKKRIADLIIPLTIRGERTWQEAPGDIDIAVIFFRHVSTETRAAAPAEAERYSQSASTQPEDVVWLANRTVKVPDEVESEVSDSRLSDFFYTGFPLGIHSNSWLRSFTRRCTLAANSIDGMPDIDSNPNYFLVDCVPIEGDSGSPLFIHDTQYDGRTMIITNKLIGVISGKINMNQTLHSAAQGIDTDIELSMNRRLSLLGKVAPASFIEPAVLNFLERADPATAVSTHSN